MKKQRSFMEHCKSCKEWVPDMKKHDGKIHPNGIFKK